jgi:hypothetical protein
MKASLMLRNICVVIVAILAVFASSVEAQSFVVPALPEMPGKTFNITNYGGSGDGVTTNTAAIQAAIDAASAAGGGTVEVATNREYRALNNLTPAIAATYPRGAITGRTPLYRDIIFSNITATVQPGRRAGLIWGLPEMAITNVLLQRVNITADKPFGIYDAQNVQLVDSKIITPDGVNKLSCADAQVTITPP